MIVQGPVYTVFESLRIQDFYNLQAVENPRVLQEYVNTNTYGPYGVVLSEKR